MAGRKKLFSHSACMYHNQSLKEKTGSVLRNFCRRISSDKQVADPSPTLLSQPVGACADDGQTRAAIHGQRSVRRRFLFLVLSVVFVFLRSLSVVPGYTCLVSQMNS